MSTQKYKSFIKAARAVHGKAYTYAENEFTGITHPMSITCEQHGEFTLSPNAHINLALGCPLCGNVQKVEAIVEDVEAIVEDVEAIVEDEPRSFFTGKKKAPKAK